MAKALVAIGAATVNVLTAWLQHKEGHPIPIVWVGSHKNDFLSEKIRSYIGPIEHETAHHVVGKYGELIYLATGQQFEHQDEAMQQDRECLAQALHKYDDVYVLSSLGGGTTSTVTPYVATLLAEQDPHMQAIVTLPAKLEPRSRHDKAQHAFTELQHSCPIIHLVTNNGEQYRSLVETFEKRDALLAELLNRILC